MKTVRRLLALLLLTLIYSVASAGVKVDFNESYTGGTVTYKSETDPAEDGSVVVTITVTPSLGYKISKSDILVVPTYSPSQTRTEGEPGIADKLELSGDDPENLTVSREYTFTVPANLGAWVKEANFKEADGANDISGNNESSVKWAYDAEKGEITISGTGLTADFSEENKAPWASALDQITSVVIGEGVTSLGANLFAGCSKLASIKIKNATQVLALGEGAIPEGVKIDVPGNLYNAYYLNDGWKALSPDSENKVEMENVSLGDNNDYDAFFSKKAMLVPSVLQAFAITGINEKGLILTEVTVIPADTPVLLFSDKEEVKAIKTYYSTNTENEAKGISQNLLEVAKEKKDVKLGEVYILYNDVFYYAQAGTLEQGSIYLNTKPVETKARPMYALGHNGGNTTGIAVPQLTNVEEESVWYGLDGRRLNTMPTRKGIYIKNGKKVVIK